MHVGSASAEQAGLMGVDCAYAGTAAAASKTNMEAMSSGAFATPLTGSGEATSLRQEDTPVQEATNSGTSEQTTTGASTANG